MTLEKQRKYDVAYLRIAREWGKLSYCKRRQVGAIIVKDNMIISCRHQQKKNCMKLKSH